MIEIVFRHDPDAKPRPLPKTPKAVKNMLEAGNAAFGRLLGSNAPERTIVDLDISGLGAGDAPGSAPVQRPFAVVLGCADARVPLELVFLQACNDLFVVRVAGNVLGSECLGSIDYALDKFRSSVRLIVVLGHSGCGAVTEAVDAYMTPSRYLALAKNHPLRSVVDRLFVAVAAADRAIAGIWGTDAGRLPNYRKVLIEMSVVLNAAMAASVLQAQTRSDKRAKLGTVYGYYDLAERQVRLPQEAARSVAHFGEVGLADPPRNETEFEQLGLRLATSEAVTSWLHPKKK